MTDYDCDFEKVDAGSSLTIPAEAGDIKKNGYMVFNGRPCKVVDYSTAKTGKHGHAKASITGIDIFNGKKYEDSQPTSHTVEVPIITRTQWLVMSVDDDSYVTLFDPNGGEPRSDLKLPDDTPDDERVRNVIQDGLNEGKEIMVTVLSSMGIEKITDPKESTS